MEQKGGDRGNSFFAGLVRAGAFFAGLVRAEFGYGLIRAGVTAAIKEMTSGRLVSPRKGGARLYVASGMSREAAQEMEGWRLPEVKGNVYDKARCEDVAPEVRVALKRASGRVDTERFVKGLEEAVTLLGQNEVGLARPTCRRQRYAHTSCVFDLLKPVTVTQSCPDFLSLAGWRARVSNLSTD